MLVQHSIQTRRLTHNRLMGVSSVVIWLTERVLSSTSSITRCRGRSEAREPSQIGHVSICYEIAPLPHKLISVVSRPPNGSERRDAVRYGMAEAT